MKENKAKDNFILQAGILAAAGIVSRIIGLLYRSPLHSVIGKRGLGYYSSAYNYYTIILLISSYSIPAAISKVIAQKLGVGEYKNAHRLFRGALVYVLIIGAIASSFLYFGAGLFVSEEAIPVLRTFAPTIFIYGILGVLRGYFQAHKTMIPTSVSQILEQIANALVSIGGAYLLIRHAFGTLEMPTEELLVTKRGIQGAVGSAIGTGAGVATALIFMALVYWLNKKELDKRIASDVHEKIDSYAEITKVIIFVVTPFILNTAICNLSATVNNVLYTKLLPTLREVATDYVYDGWGLFNGQATTISNIPIAFATAMAAAMIPTVAQLIAKDDKESAKGKIGLAVKSTMLISIPCAVGIFALAEPITYLLFPSNSPEDNILSGRFLMALSLSVIFYAYSTLNSQILQGLGKVNIPIVNAGIALIVQTVLGYLLLFKTGLDLYSIALANTVYAGMMCMLNQRAVHKAIGYKQEMLNTFVRPAIAAALMGGIARAAYALMLLLIKSPRIALLPAIGVGVVSYFILLIVVQGVTESELRALPKGYLLVKLAKKCHMM